MSVESIKETIEDSEGVGVYKKKQVQDGYDDPFGLI